MKKTAHLERLVRKLDSTTKLSAQEREMLLDLPVNFRSFDAGSDLVSEGDRTTQCGLVVEGLLCRYKRVGSGERQILSLHIPGDIPDLHSLHIEVMDHSLGALTAAQVGFIPHDAVRKVIRASHTISQAFWREALIDAAIFREWMVGIGRRPAASRLAHLLCEFIAKLEAVGLSDGASCELPLTQTEIADALGLSTVHTSKKFAELRRARLIQTKGRNLKILDWDGLCELGEFDPTYLHLR